MHSELVLTMIAAYFQVKNNLAICQVVEKLIDSSFGLGFGTLMTICQCLTVKKVVNRVSDKQNSC